MPAQREVASLIISLEGQIKGLKKQLGIAGGELGKFQKQHKGIFTNIKQHWLGYTAAIAGATIAIKRFISPFAAFQHRMLEVNTLIGLSDKNFKKFSKTVLNMTKRIPQSARELADALYDIVSAGIDVADANNVLEQSAKAAIAGVTNTKVAANAALSVINAYGLELKELGSIYDILFKTVKLGVLTFEQLSGSIGTVLPTARAANVEFSEIAASIAVLTKQGIAVNRATTFMRSGINALVAPTEEARKNMEKMGIVWDGWIPTLRQIHARGLDLKQMRNLIPDIRAGQAIIGLTQNFEELEETLEEMDDAAGSLEAAYKIMLKSPINQTKLLANAINNLKIRLTELVAPETIMLLGQLTDQINEMADGWAYLNRELANDAGLNRFELDMKLISDALKKAKKRRNDLILERDTLKLLGDDPTETIAQIERYNQWIIKLNKNITGLVDATKKPKPVTPTGDIEDDPTVVIDKETLKIQETSLKLFNEQVKTILADMDHAFEENQLTIKEYYHERRELAVSAYDAEIAALEDLLKQTDEENKQREIQTEIQVRQIAIERELVKLKREEAQAEIDLTEKKKELQKILGEIDERVFADRTDEYARDLAELQEKQRAEKDSIIALKLDEITQKKALEQAYDSWKIEKDNLLLENERKVQQKRLEMLSASYGDISSAFSQLYETSGKKIKAFFLLSKAAALAEAFVNYNLAMLKIESQLGIYSAFAKTSAAVALGANIAAIAASTIAGFAEGGGVEGKSGKDKINAKLTKGEFVQPEGSVKYYGAGVMEAMRRRAIPKGLFSGFGGLKPLAPSGAFQTGGLATGEDASRELSFQINNIVNPEMMGQYLMSRPGQAMILNVISDNAYEVKRRIVI